MRNPINSSKAPAAIGPYSHGFKCDSFVFTSGQLGLDAVCRLLAVGFAHLLHGLAGILEEVLHAQALIHHA